MPKLVGDVILAPRQMTVAETARCQECGWYAEVEVQSYIDGRVPEDYLEKLAKAHMNDKHYWGQYDEPKYVGS